MLECGGATGGDEWYPQTRLDELIKLEPRVLTEFTKHHNSLPTDALKKLLDHLWVDELTLYAELAERITKEHYKAIYESMKVRQEGDGTLEYVSAIVEGLVGKPADARQGWPNIPHLKEAIGKLPGKVKVPSNGKRAVLIQLIALTWRSLPEGQRPALTRKPIAAAAAPPATATFPLPAAPAPPPAAVTTAITTATAAIAATAATAATATAPTTAVTFSLPAAPAPPPPLAEQQLLDGADTVAAESIVDAEEADAEEEAGWQAEQRLWRPLSRRRLSSSLWSADTALGASQQRA